MTPTTHAYELKSGIVRTPEFERKKLASFAVNVGLKCGHDCTYCSSPTVLRTHPAFKQLGESPFGRCYCIVDPSTLHRVARDAQRIPERGLVQLCTLTDAWAPEAQHHNLGRCCLQAILAQPGWSVRILTKNAAVVKDFDLIGQHRGRVLVGLSITATPDKSRQVAVLEPYASTIQQRMDAMLAASRAGLRSYAMFCPLLPGIADSPEHIDELMRFAASCGVEEVFCEPVNARGNGLRLCQEALEQSGFKDEARAIEKIRHREHWSRYVLELIAKVQRSTRKHLVIGKLRFLLYPSNLLPEHVEQIRRDDAGVAWLGKQQPADASENHSTAPTGA